jgi:hypothetical protein
MVKKMTPFDLLSQIKKSLLKYGPIFSKKEINEIMKMVDQEDINELINNLNWINHIIKNNPIEKINFNLPNQHDKIERIYQLEEEININKSLYIMKDISISQFLLILFPRINELLNMNLDSKKPWYHKVFGGNK